MVAAAQLPGDLDVARLIETQAIQVVGQGVARPGDVDFEVAVPVDPIAKLDGPGAQQLDDVRHGLFGRLTGPRRERGMRCGECGCPVGERRVTRVRDDPRPVALGRA